MCQIICGASQQIKLVLLATEGLLEELHTNNPDGFGAMYRTTKGVKAIKKLPRSSADTRKLIEKLPSDDRSVALHWRWKTSGIVDQENAHPHLVDGGWVIHNGVLDIDMSSNPDRCDTHHFAREYLDGSMPLLVHSPKMLALLGEFIGNNRFVLMDDAGTMVIVNPHQGYTAQGLWFANSYSMSRSLVDPTYQKNLESDLNTWHASKGFELDLLAEAIDEDPQEALSQFFRAFPSPYSEGNPFSRAINRKDVQSLCTLLLESDEDPYTLAEALLNSI